MLVAQACPALCDPMDYSQSASSLHDDSPGKNAAVGCHALLQGIFPTQGSNLSLPYCRHSLWSEPQRSPFNQYQEAKVTELFLFQAARRPQIPFMASPGPDPAVSTDPTQCPDLDNGLVMFPCWTITSWGQGLCLCSAHNKEHCMIFVETMDMWATEQHNHPFPFLWLNPASGAPELTARKAQKQIWS